MKQFQVAIIGGGASGVFAALHACKKYRRGEVIIVEGGERLMRKLAQTGNGRGNISNHDISPEKFFGDDCSSIIQRFPLSATLDFFASLGVAVSSIGSKIYPRSLSASSLVDLLRFSIEREGVEVMLSSQVSTLQKRGDTFHISTSKGEVCAKKVIVAMGGSAAPHLNTDGSGVALLSSLGHTATPLFPALVQMKTTSLHTKVLKGIKAEVSASFLLDGKVLATRTEEMHFSEFALSGPVAFLLSTFSAPHKRGNVVVDFLPEFSHSKLASLLVAKAKLYPTQPAETLLFTVVQNQIARTIAKECGMLGKPISTLSPDDISTIAKTTKAFDFDFAGNLSFQKCQSTMGGISLSDFDENLQSKIVPSLFACGEVLNVCGECGGFNLQWAWSSSAVCGSSV